MNNFFTAVSIALAFVGQIGAALAAIKAHQAVSIPPFNTYIEGAHVSIGPIPINPL